MSSDLTFLTQEFFAPAGNTLSDVWQTFVGDRVTHWRLRNAMKLQKHTAAEAKRLGLVINSDKLPDRFVFSWFEEATKSDEPEIQILFARLLARAGTGDAEAQDRRLISILKEMTPTDAAIFQRVYSNKPFPDTGPYSDTKAIGSSGGFAGPVWPRDWMTALVDHFHVGQAKQSVEHLVLIGCLGLDYKSEGSPNARVVRQQFRGNDVDWRRTIQSFSALRGYVTSTELGRSLANALAE